MISAGGVPGLSSAPEALRELAGWLADAGTLRVDSFNSPGNQRLRALTSLGTVQVVADRGQWFVELAPPGLSEYFDTAVWSACITGAEVGLDLVPLDAQVAWLHELVAGGVPGEVSVECLVEVRRWRAHGRMGLTP